MGKLDIQSVCAAFEQLAENLDAFFAGRPWHARTQRRAEKAFDQAFEATGALSFETRRAAVHLVSADFAVDFWRPASASVQAVVKMAERAGVPRCDLQLLVLNRDLQATPKGVRLRRSWVLEVVSVATSTLIVVHWALMMVLCATATAPGWLRVSVAAVVTLLYWVAHRGWSLYLRRACAALRRRRAEMEAVLQLYDQQQASVVRRYPPDASG